MVAVARWRDAAQAGPGACPGHATVAAIVGEWRKGASAGAEFWWLAAGGFGMMRRFREVLPAVWISFPLPVPCAGPLASKVILSLARFLPTDSRSEVHGRPESTCLAAQPAYPPRVDGAAPTTVRHSDCEHSEREPAPWQ